MEFACQQVLRIINLLKSLINFNYHGCNVSAFIASKRLLKGLATMKCMAHIGSVGRFARNLLLAMSMSWSLEARQFDFAEQFQRGVEALRSGELNKAADAFGACVRSNPESAEAAFNLGLVELRQGHSEQAAGQLTRALKLKPNMRGANLFLGMADYRLSHFAQAVGALRLATQQEPANTQAWMWLGMAESGAGDDSAAVSALQKAAHLKPNDVDILFHLGRAYMNLSKQTYDHMYQADPKSWRVHQVLCQSFDEAEREEDAIKECKQAITLQPAEPGLHELLGEVYRKQNRLSEAEEEFSNELALDPENDISIFKLATVEIEESKAHEAAKLLADFLHRHPESGEAHYQMGRAEAQVGQDPDAIRDFSYVINHHESASPGSDIVQQAYYQLAQLYRRTQRPEESRIAMAEFVRMKQESDARRNNKLEEKMKRTAEAQNQSAPGNQGR